MINTEISDKLTSNVNFTPYQHFKITLRFIKDSISFTINKILKCNYKNNVHYTRGNVVFRINGEFGKEEYEKLLKKGLEGMKDIKKGI